MRIEYPQYRTQIDTYVGLNPDDPLFHYWVWEKPVGATFIYVTCIGPGGGGGSGRRGAAGTMRGGGQGGYGGAMNTGIFAAALLPDTVNILVGEGGLGGPGVSTDDTNGEYGEEGFPTRFGDTGMSYLQAAAGLGGARGRSYYDPPQPPNADSMAPQGAGAVGGELGHSAVGCPGGGGGGLIGASDDVVDGGWGGQSLGFAYNGVPALSAADGADFPLLTPGPGKAGGGGFGQGNGSLDGGNGGKYGAGGGGGSGVTNGTVTSGAGGNGGDGICVVVTFF